MALSADRQVQIKVIETADMPVLANTVCYAGGFVGDNASGYARALVAADPFWGIAIAQCNNNPTGGAAAGARHVKLATEFEITGVVTGASSVADVDELVYASADDAMTLTSTNNTLIGKVARWVTSTTCVVRGRALTLRD